jgi:hypothetical protein
VIRGVVAESMRRNRLLTIVALAHLLLFVLLLPAVFLDSMQILGINRWIKPMKFAISISIFTGTMGWLLGYLQQSERAVRAISAVIAFTMSVETVLVTGQALRGVRSHFNEDSWADAAVFSAMGMLIFANTLAVICATYLFFRRPSSASGAFLTGIRLGLLLFVVASMEGGLIVKNRAHTVGAHDGGPGLPLVNWSTNAGDLRIAHFVGMHALQVLPVMGWLLDRRRARRGSQWIYATAGVWAIVTALLVLQALAGSPLVALR